MPYIKKKWRTLLDPLLVKLVQQIKTTARMEARDTQPAPGDGYAREPSETEVMAATVGVFNYVITALAVTLTGEPSYFRCAALRAAMADAAQEYYRRLVAPYEDGKARQNGDVYPPVAPPPSRPQPIEKGVR